MKKEWKSWNSTLRPKSAKQKKLDKLWLECLRQRLQEQIDDVGYAYCRWCGRNVNAHIIKHLDPHHIIPRSLGGSYELDNCYIVVGECHDEIKLIDVGKYPTKRDWLLAGAKCHQDVTLNVDIKDKGVHR